MIRLPPEITFKKRPLPDGGWCYDFHHSALGALGRVLLHAMPDGRNTRITCELAEAQGDPNSPYNHPTPRHIRTARAGNIRADGAGRFSEG